MVGHEDGTPQGVQQADLADVGIGVVDEYAGVHVAVGVDVQVAVSPGNAPAHKFRVVLEVHGKEGLFRPHSADPAVDPPALFGCG